MTMLPPANDPADHTPERTPEARGARDQASLPIRRLRSDPLWLGLLAVVLVTVALYLMPFLTPDELWYYAVYAFDPPLIVAILLVLESGRRHASRRRERQFWAAWIAALACWLGNWGLFIVAPVFSEERGGELFADALNLLYYLFAFLAATAQPHLTESFESVGESGLTPKVLGTWLFGFFLMTYFVLIPVTLEPGIYATYIPSYLMYVTLDVLLVATYARLAHLAGTGGWRRGFALVATTAAIWLVLDVIEFLQWIETLPWVDSGTALDLLWILPYLPLAAAARLQVLQPAAPTALLAHDGSAAVSESHGGRALLVVYTAVFPVFHFAGYAIGLAEPSIRQAREACVFLAVLVLGALAVFAHHRLESERRDAEQRVRQQKDRLRALSHRLARAQEDERRQIARELHDEIGQQLTGLRLSLGALRVRGGDIADSDLAHLEERFSDLLQQVRELSLSLRPTTLDDHGLVPALKWLFKRLEGQTGLHIAFEPLASFDALPGDAQLAAYRVVQEALTNVIRHAGVDAATVRLDADPHEYWVEIRDAGAGFVPEAVAVGTSCGIDGMHERAELLGGSLQVSSAPGHGTRVTMRLRRDA